MRWMFFLAQAMVLISLAYWAYNENYATHDALRRVDKLQREIGRSRESLGVLKAEWAYFNRPDRLRELADLNFDTLGLIPLQAEHFGDIEQVAYPKLNLLDLTKTVDTSASDDVLTTINPDAPDQKDAQ